MPEEGRPEELPGAAWDGGELAGLGGMIGGLDGVGAAWEGAERSGGTGMTG